MARKTVKTRHLMKVLKQLGFMASRSGSHMIFRHSDTGLVVTVPGSRKEIPEIYLRSIMKQMQNYDIISEEKLKEILLSSDVSQLDSE